MPARDIIVIGASLRGVEALQVLMRNLPWNSPAALFVVVHMGPRTRSLLPRILSSVGPLPVFRAPIEHASIYVAPPDKHLIVPRDQVHLSIGPKEQHHRPCINVTFCSAALAFGDRVAR